MHTNPLSGARYPDSTDNTNLPAYYQDLADDLSQVTVNQFASGAARDTAWSTYTSAGHTLTNGSKCTVAGAPQTYRGKWVGDLETQYRRIAGTASGTLAAGVSANLCAVQTIPASPFGTSVNYVIDVDALTHCPSLPSGSGFKIELFYDGVLQGGCEYSNAGTTACRQTLIARELLTVGDNLTHTITATVTNLAGGATLTLDTTYSRLILAMRPFVTF